MTFPELLRRIVSVLDEEGIPYMLTGSLAAAFHGVPRATQDIDLVAGVEEKHLGSLVQGLIDLDLCVNLEAAHEAVVTQGQFNAIDPKTGWKVDLFVRKERRFSQEEFARRTRGKVEGFEVALATREDMILAKMEWAKLGSSMLQLDDVRILLERGEHNLDLEYIERWVDELGLDAQWATVQLSAGPGSP